MKQRSGAIRILVLTDHRAHNADNSVYDLCRSLATRPDVAEVSIASRGNPVNDAFFQHHTGDTLQAHLVGTEFHFKPSGVAFLDQTREVALADYDWIWLRLPRPIPADFFPWLTRCLPEQRIINRPSGIAETSSKAFLLNLAHWCPEVHLCTSLEHIEALQKQHPIVLKPFENYGGRGIIKVSDGWVNSPHGVFPLADYADRLQDELQRGGYLAMRFLKNVHLGDKRIVVVNGHIVGAALRMPAPGSWMCNASQGGISEYARPDKRELDMVEDINSILSPKGIVMFGVDTLTDDDGHRVLSEINTLSTGGIKQIAEHARLPLVERSTEYLLGYLLQHAQS